jgi:hypothetical protein
MAITRAFTNSQLDSRVDFYYTATSGQTTFSGSDDNGSTLSYTASGAKDVYLNGTLLIESDDYVATNGTSVVLQATTQAGDIVHISVNKVMSSLVNLVDTTVDLNGNELILDADGDTSITADTDDQIDVKIAGSDKVVLDANGVKINGSTSGGITLAVPAVAGTNTLTLPASTGEITVGGNNTPLFYVRMTATQTGIGDAVETKIEWDTVVHEVGVTFDTTNHRFTVPSGGAGYYQLNAFAHLRTSVNTDLQACYLAVYINGSKSTTISQFNFATNYVRLASPSINHILNLSEGDYVEMYAYINTVNAGSSRTINSNQSGWTMHKLIT